MANLTVRCDYYGIRSEELAAFSAALLQGLGMRITEVKTTVSGGFRITWSGLTGDTHQATVNTVNNYIKLVNVDKDELKELIMAYLLFNRFISIAGM